MRLDYGGSYPRPQERPPPLCGGSLATLAAFGVDCLGEFLAALDCSAAALLSR